MSLTPGTRIGPYEVIELLGAGGMGEVYRARDTALDRDAAIKALPAIFASDQERVARFEREARVLANLHHPNIGAIYSLETHAGQRYLALEFVPGETLEQRLKRGPLPIDEAIDVAGQVATALETAHESGVVHRDLKPGNIMLTPGGQVKVLDFGLAKPTPPADASSASRLSHSPTLTIGGTMQGTILGTAAYMSPEQARGKPVDRRTDIWAFGCVVFECLTGQQLFGGETVSDTIARILERNPDWETLPAGMPQRLRTLLRRCLDKDQKKRLRDIGDARIEIEEIAADAVAGRDSGPVAVSRARAPRTAPWIPLAIGLVVGTAAFAAGYFLRRPAPAEAPVTRVSILLPDNIQVRFAFLAPNGNTVFALGRPRHASPGDDNRPRIYVRQLSGYEWQPLAGTEGAVGYDHSPDGRQLTFLAPVARGAAELQLWRLPVDGSSPAVAFAPYETTWRQWAVMPNGDVIAASRRPMNLVVLPAAGGKPMAPRVIEGLEDAADLALHRPLPDGSGCFATKWSYEKGRGYYSRAGLVDVGNARFIPLAENAANPALAPSGDLIMTRNDALLAASFDASNHRIKGSPVAVLKGIKTAYSWEHGLATISGTGSLLYAPGGVSAQGRRLAILDLDGNVEPWTEGTRAFEMAPAVSPDGNTAAVVLVPPGRSIYEIWLSHKGRPGLTKFVASPNADCVFPVFSPDGRSVAYERNALDAEDGLYIQSLDGGAPRRLLAADPPRLDHSPLSWSRDGRHLLVESTVDGMNQLDLIRMDSPTPEARLLVGGTSAIQDGILSPDGRRLAYVSTETGNSEVLLTTLDAAGRAGPSIPVSRAGGMQPMWSPDGSVLYFLSPRLALMAARVDGEATLSVALPEEKLDLTPWMLEDTITPLPDGRFLIIQKDEEEGEIRRLDLVLNWGAELEEALRRAGE